MITRAPRASLPPLLAALALLAGCGDDRGPADGQPIAVEDFCSALVTATCGRATRCGCETVINDLADSCAETVAARCPVDRGSPLREAFDSGAVVWDGAAAARLLSRMDEGPCEEELCPADRVACLGLGEEGQPCGEDVVGCNPGLLCVSGACLAARADGAACSESIECMSGRCADAHPTIPTVCVARAAEGDACAEDLECETGRCDFSTGRCGSLVVDGQLCADDADCMSGHCEVERALGTRSCQPLGADGEECTEDTSCFGGLCVDSVCAARACDAAN